MDASAIPILDCPVSAPRPGTLGLMRVAVDDANAQLIVTFEFKNATTGVDLALQVTTLDPRRYTISGGTRRFPHVVSAAAVAGSDRKIALALDQIGDFSVYTLTFSDPNVDPFFASHRFRFRLDCDDPFDCREPGSPGPAPTSVTDPASAAGPSLPTLSMSDVRSSSAGVRPGLAIASPANNCQNLRRPANDRPLSLMRARQERARGALTLSLRRSGPVRTSRISRVTPLQRARPPPIRGYGSAENSGCGKP